MDERSAPSRRRALRDVSLSDDVDWVKVPTGLLADVASKAKTTSVGDHNSCVCCRSQSVAVNGKPVSRCGVFVSLHLLWKQQVSFDFFCAQRGGRSVSERQEDTQKSLLNVNEVTRDLRKALSTRMRSAGALRARCARGSVLKSGVLKNPSSWPPLSKASTRPLIRSH
jgi:hypothetical protein